MPPLRDTLSRRSKTSCNRSYSPLLCRSRKSVSLSWRDGPLSANSIFTPTPPMQKQYGFLTVCKNREMRSFRESALSKVIPLTSGRDSAATAPMSTLFICSSSCVVNFPDITCVILIGQIPTRMIQQIIQCFRQTMYRCIFHGEVSKRYVATGCLM